jgi:hypothetical protein
MNFNCDCVLDSLYERPSGFRPVGTEGVNAVCAANFKFPHQAGAEPSICAEPPGSSEEGVKVAICTDHPEVPINYLAMSASVAMEEENGPSGGAPRYHHPAGSNLRH